MEFINGFNSWHETHFEVVSQISYYSRQDKITSPLVREYQEASGTGGLYELAFDLTNEFEKLHEFTIWDGQYFDVIDRFLKEKLK